MHLPIIENLLTKKIASKARSCTTTWKTCNATMLTETLLRHNVERGGGGWGGGGVEVRTDNRNLSHLSQHILKLVTSSPI